MLWVPTDHEDRFLAGPIHKLADPIRFYIERKECKTTDDILSLLKVRYTPCRGYGELHTDLERISMSPRETLIDYIHRVSRLYRQVTARAK